jgi:rare lipoprotein A
LRTKILTVVLLALAAAAGCGHKRHARRIPAAPRPPAAAPQPGDTETGIASWYGHPYHGRAAADGEIYDMETMVAAHRTFPFQTWVRVDNLDNGKSVELRVIDRGPFIEGRIIDVSHAAARALEMIGPGTARVRVEVIRTPPAAVGSFAVQVGAFRVQENAERVRQRMESGYGAARLAPRAGTPGVWRVLVGSEGSEEGAAELAGRIRVETGEKNIFVVRLD